LVITTSLLKKGFSLLRITYPAITTYYCIITIDLLLNYSKFTTPLLFHYYKLVFHYYLLLRIYAPAITAYFYNITTSLLRHYYLLTTALLQIGFALLRFITKI
jgi:hypothetical protein